MNLLLIAAAYPHATHPFAGAFNERCAVALQALCKRLEVLSPRPFAPAPIARLNPRWKVYAGMPPHEVRAGISIHRPAFLQIPRVGAALWSDVSTYFGVRETSRDLHRRVSFDAVLSFDLISTGGLAWRLGRDLGIPAAGWSTASVEVTPASSYASAVKTAVDRLSLIFYQSHAKRREMARLLSVSETELAPDKHVVLARGVPEPPTGAQPQIRERIRRTWKVGMEQIVVLSIGRLIEAKGVFELLDAISIAASMDPRVTAIMVGAMPGFDQSEAVERRVRTTPSLNGRVRIFPACDPATVFDYLSAADIFAFPSHQEGMPNSLLEAMSMGVPAICFAIPAVQEIEAGTGALVLTPPVDSRRFAQEIVRLAGDPSERARVGALGRAQVMERYLLRNNMSVAFARLSDMARSTIVPRNTHERTWARSGG